MKNPAFPTLIRKRLRLVLIVSTLFTVGSALHGESPSLQQRFEQPVESAKPWVYWFWMNGNISKEGITADLEALADNGFGGVLQMSTTLGIPAGPYAFNSPEWRELMQHALAEADRLGLEFTLHQNAGYCGSGGPHITPEMSMQTLTASQTFVTGPGEQNIQLKVPSTHGDFYRDVALYAIPLADKEIDITEATMTSSEANVDLSPLKDGDPDSFIRFRHPSVQNPVTFTFEFSEPVAVRSFTVRTPLGPNGIGGHLEASNDGVNYHVLAPFQIARPAGSRGLAQITVDETKARFFRFVFNRRDPRSGAINRIAELDLSVISQISDAPRKAGFTFQGPVTLPEVLSTKESLPLASLVDLSDRISGSGEIVWDVPEGEWSLFRIGHTSTGKVIVAGPEAGTGLEVNKMNREDLRYHFENYFFPILEAAEGDALTTTHIDSWEIGTQNWTPGFAQEFESLRGYDPMPYLPILFGWNIGSEAISERFLQDYRLTISDLITREYFGGMRELMHEKGLKLNAQMYGHGYFNSLQAGREADQPMAEFWLRDDDPYHRHGPLAESAARLQGKSLVGAEAFTSGEAYGKWTMHPARLKVLGDRYFARGINRFVFHRYAMQPWTDRFPGMTYGPFGIHLDRTNTWFRNADAYYSYLTRCQSLLQAEAPKDFLILMSEDAPNFPVRPAYAISRHYDYLFGLANDANDLIVEDDRIQHPSGQSFSLLVLPSTATISPQHLKEIKRIVESGGHVLGPRPTRAPGLKDYPDADALVVNLASELWGDGASGTRRHSGGGSISWGKNVDAVMSELGLEPTVQGHVTPSVELTESSIDPIMWTRRTSEDGTVFFLSNQTDTPLLEKITFREFAESIEIWDPVDGTRRPYAFWVAEPDGRTTIEVALEPEQSLFYYFSGEPTDSIQVSDFLLDRQPARAPQASEAQKLEVEKAVYGTLDAPIKQFDVTEKLRALIAAGETQVRVLPQFLDCGDPAPSRKKFLTAQFTINGERIQRQVADFDYMTFPESIATGGWKVASAKYGLPGDPTSVVDLSHFFQNLINTGGGEIQVLPAIFKIPDPAPSQQKTLHIVLKADSEEKVIQANDLQTIQVPGRMDGLTPVATENNLVPDIRQIDGQWKVLSHEPGYYAIRDREGRTMVQAISAAPPSMPVAGPWQLAFSPQFNYGEQLPKSRELTHLIDWTRADDDALRHFSGTGTYTTQFNLPESWDATEFRAVLDLGEVGVLAEVTVNDQPTVGLWHAPYQLDVTDLVQSGTNTLRIEITNLWTNRLIGDSAKPAAIEYREGEGRPEEWSAWIQSGTVPDTGRVTFSTWDFYDPEDELLSSGLIGPVSLHFQRETEIVLESPQ